MSTKTITKPTTEGPLAEWPPLAHLTADLPLRKGSIAFCGAKLMGIDLPDASKICTKCIKIARQRISGL